MQDISALLQDISALMQDISALRKNSLLDSLLIYTKVNRYFNFKHSNLKELRLSFKANNKKI
jgi:hypothetical protein